MSWPRTALPSLRVAAGRRCRRNVHLLAGDALQRRNWSPREMDHRPDIEGLYSLVGGKLTVVELVGVWADVIDFAGEAHVGSSEQALVEERTDEMSRPPGQTFVAAVCGCRFAAASLEFRAAPEG